MLSQLLFLIHAILFFAMYLSVLFPPRLALYMWYVYTLVIASWIVFDGCILNDIEKGVSKDKTVTFNFTNRLFNLIGIDIVKHEKELKYFIDVSMMLVYIFLSVKVNKDNYAMPFLFLYFILNGGLVGKGWKTN